MANFGLSFVPGAEQNGQQRPGGPGGAPSGVPPLQQAVQLLSLRLPRVMGGQALAPGPLMQGPAGGGLGLPGGALEELLKRLFGMPGGLPSMPSGQQKFGPGQMPGASGLLPSGPRMTPGPSPYPMLPSQPPGPVFTPGMREGAARPGATPPPRWGDEPGPPPTRGPFEPAPGPWGGGPPRLPTNDWPMPPSPLPSNDPSMGQTDPSEAIQRLMAASRGRSGGGGF